MTYQEKEHQDLYYLIIHSNYGPGIKGPFKTELEQRAEAFVIWDIDDKNNKDSIYPLTISINGKASLEDEPYDSFWLTIQDEERYERIFLGEYRCEDCDSDTYFKKDTESNRFDVCRTCHNFIHPIESILIYDPYKPDF